jgi:hypothetical protein
MFENRVLRKIFGPKRDEETGDWRKLHNKDLLNVFSSANIIRQIKSRRMRWVWHMAQTGEEGFGRKARRKETTRKTEV